MKKFLHSSPILLLFVFITVNGFSQIDTAKQTSEHPLLDKYYPRPKSDKVAKNPVIKSTGVQQKTVISAPNKPQPIEEKRLTFPTPATRPEIVAAPVQKDSIQAEVETPVMTPVSKGVVITDSKLETLKTDSVKIAKPVIATATTTPPPVQKPPSKVDPGYQRNRLGSSSPLYNTYKKNANGAGSVTTLPKQ